MTNLKHKKGGIKLFVMLVVIILILLGIYLIYNPKMLGFVLKKDSRDTQSTRQIQAEFYYDPVTDTQTGWSCTGTDCATGHYAVLDDGTRQPNTPILTDYIYQLSNGGGTDEHQIGTITETNIKSLILWVYVETGAGHEMTISFQNDGNEVGTTAVPVSTGQSWTSITWNSPTGIGTLSAEFTSAKIGGGGATNGYVYAWYVEVNSDLSPNVTQNTPINNYATATTDSVTFNCSAQDDIQLSNISLYLTDSTNQSFSLNQTTAVSGTSNSSEWTLFLSPGNYTWNCKVFDNDSQSAWADNRSIEVVTAPVINIISPENKTYITNTSLSLNYTVFGEEAVWYNIDNGANITLTENITFNISEGQHTLYLFANDSLGVLNSKNVTFNVNLTKVSVIYEDYQKGTTTSVDFNQIPYEDLINLSGLYLENQEYGKISFNENINVIDDINPNDGVVDIDSNTDISYNHIEIDSIRLPNFDKPATLWLYDLPFDNPRILKNGKTCSPLKCEIEDYSGGTLRFNVDSWSIYSAEESPVTGGSGGATLQDIKEFKLRKTIYTLPLVPGEIKDISLEITNLKDYPKSFTLNVSENLKDFVEFPDGNSFNISAAESKNISVLFNIPENETYKIYFGGIKITDEKGNSLNVVVTIEIESPEILFELELNTPKKQEGFLPGEDLISIIKPQNLGKRRSTKVDLDYTIRNQENKIILNKKESINLTGNLTEIGKTLYLPKNIEQGDYMLYVSMEYAGSKAIKNKAFRVVSPSVFESKTTIIIFSIIGGLIVLAIIGILAQKYEWFKHKRRTPSKPNKSEKYKKRIRKNLEDIRT